MEKPESLRMRLCRSEIVQRSNLRGKAVRQLREAIQRRHPPRVFENHASLRSDSKHREVVEPRRQYLRPSGCGRGSHRRDFE